MTDEVAALVLRDNYLQAQALARNVTTSPRMCAIHQRYIQTLEDAGRIDRQLERLPPDKEFDERRRVGEGLTTPELAVLLAHSKMLMFDELVRSQLPEDPFLSRELQHYFPQPLRERFAGSMAGHRLRREIIANAVTNDLLNRQELTFVFRLQDQTDAGYADIARAYTVAREVLALPEFWADVDALDARVETAIQMELLICENERVEWLTRWLLRQRPLPIDISKEVARYSDMTAMLNSGVAALLTPSDQERYTEHANRLMQLGVPEHLAHRVGAIDSLLSLSDVVDVSVHAGESVLAVGELYFAIGERLHLDWLRDEINLLSSDSQWETLARLALREDLFSDHRAVTTAVLRVDGNRAPQSRLEAWLTEHAAAVHRVDQLITDVRKAGSPNAATLGVALRELHLLVGST